MPPFTRHSGEYLPIDAANIYYEVAGNENKPALVVLHGAFGSMEDFNNMLSGLTHAFKLIGIDSRGQGKSTMGPHALTYARLQHDVERVLDHLRIDTFTLLGFSDGGVVAYRLASLTARKIEKLVTIGSRWHHKIAQATEGLLMKFGGTSKENYEAFRRTYQRLNPEPDFDALDRALFEMWMDNRASGYPNEAIADVTCPLLIVRGDDDRVMAREDVVEVAGRVNGARLLNIPFAGHDAFDDQPEIFLTSLRTFLQL